MTDPELNTLWLHDRVGRLREGDRVAADELLRAIANRLENLARRMLRGFPGVRIGAEVGRVPQAPPVVTPRRAASLQSQEAPALANSGMRRRTKILLYVAAGVAFAASAYSIDHHVVDVTPSSLGTRKD